MSDAPYRVALYTRRPPRPHGGAKVLNGSAATLKTAANSRLQHTPSPRRYGWHATIVAPFQIEPGVAPADVLATARAWASPSRVPVRAVEMGRFTALRAMPSRISTAKRIHAGMSERQIALLREWGYPLRVR